MKTFAIAALLALMLAGGALAAEQAAETPESPSRGYREEAVLGCYHEEEHVCDCNVTSEECDAKNAAEEGATHFYTDLCGDWCSAPDPEKVVAGCLQFDESTGAHSCGCTTPTSYCESSGNIVTEACACTVGCYDEETHMCDCDVSREECSAGSDSAFFTALCHAKCSAPADFMPGCLSFDESGSHGCKCEVSEEECAENEDIWTDSCDCTVEDVLGCYAPDHTCDCEISREECEAKDDHDWSGLCSDKCIHGDAVMTGCLVFEDDGRHQCECDVPQSACTGEQRILTEACACFPGCYDEEDHMCDCDRTESECSGAGEFYTALCDSKCASPRLHEPGCLVGVSELSPEGTPGAHSCDCELSESECSGAAGIWTDSCQCFVPAGCYTMATHSCDCSTPEEDCLAGNVEGERPAYYWTESCLGTDGELCSHEDFGLRPSGNSPGCYDYVMHECKCELYEDECTDENVGSGVTWTDSCRCPAREVRLDDN